MLTIILKHKGSQRSECRPTDKLDRHWISFGHEYARFSSKSVTKSDSFPVVPLLDFTDLVAHFRSHVAGIRHGMSREVEKRDVDPLPRTDHDVPRALSRPEPVLLGLHRRDVTVGLVQLDVVVILTLSLAAGRNYKVKLKIHIKKVMEFSCLLIIQRKWGGVKKEFSTWDF